MDVNSLITKVEEKGCAQPKAKQKVTLMDKDASDTLSDFSKNWVVESDDDNGLSLEKLKTLVTLKSNEINRLTGELESLKAENLKLKSKKASVGFNNELTSKIEKLEHDNFQLSESIRPLNRNEVKFFEAIPAELIKAQESGLVSSKSKWVSISNNTFRKIYKVHSTAYKMSLDTLIERRLIDRRETSYSGNVPTFEFCIIK
ncbi:MAG: hypothetical protein JKY54_00100 [Flavobacteriales bacterium]|nr:hypothetical protein [Flavobacteriales bacterium]